MVIYDWKYFDLRKSAGYEKWNKGEGDATIELEKVKYRSKTPWKANYSTFVGEGDNKTEYSKTQAEAKSKIKKYITTY